MELVDKLLALEFICVDIDEDAKILFNNAINPICNDMSSLDPSNIINNGKFLNLNIDLVSNRTLRALKTYKKDKNVKNHHLFVHSILLDILTFSLITKNPFNKKSDTKDHAIKRLHFLAVHTLGCSDSIIKDELFKEIQKLTLAL